MTLPRHMPFQLFANCVPVQGALRSVICDLQKGAIQFIPNSLFDILINDQGKTIHEIIDEYGEENEIAILEYFEFLIGEKLIRFCKTKEELSWFPSLNLKFEQPRLIENAIIDIDSESTHPYETLFQELNDLGCLSIQLRFFTTEKLENIKKILEFLKGNRIENVELIIKYDKFIKQKEIENIIEVFPRVVNVIIHSAPQPKDVKYNFVDIIWTDQKIDSAAHCGFISPKYFTVGVQTFAENQKYNSCLNLKIAIDHQGNIKNCPAMEKSYGNIFNTLLKSVVKNEEFIKTWKINKDQISICKDCEFRYVCSDCRAFIEDSSNLYSKPSKCNYNPYTAKWE